MFAHLTALMNGKSQNGGKNILRSTDNELNTANYNVNNNCQHCVIKSEPGECQGLQTFVVFRFESACSKEVRVK